MIEITRSHYFGFIVTRYDCYMAEFKTAQAALEYCQNELEATEIYWNI